MKSICVVKAIMPILTVLFMLRCMPATAAPAAPLKVCEPAGVARTNAPVTGGVPVAPLKVKDVNQLALFDSSGRRVFAQITPMVKLEDGTLDWVLVDLLADLAANETKTFELRPDSAADRGAAVGHPVKVDRSAEALTLSNGALKLALSTNKFNLFEQVWLDKNGDGAFSGDEQLLAAEPPRALTLVRGLDNAAFSSRDGSVHAVTLEDSGPVRATVRIDGDYGFFSEEVKASTNKPDESAKAPPADRTWLKYTARLTMWAGNPNVRLLYTIRNTNPKVATAEQIYRASVTIRAAKAKPIVDYLVGAGRVTMSRLTEGTEGITKGSQWHHSVSLDQIGPAEPVCSKSHRRFYNFTEFKEAGYRVFQFQPSGRREIVDIGFESAGWMEIGGDRGSCQVWLRSFAYDIPKRIVARNDGSLRLDVIADYEEGPQPFYSKGGYWLADLTHKSFEMYFNFHAGPTLTDADWKVFGERFQNYGPPSAATAARAAATIEQVRHPLQLVATTEWYTMTGALWGEMPSLDDEQAAGKALGRERVGPVQPQPAVHVATEYLHYEDFHGRSEYDEARDALVEFLRTGDRQFYRRAHSFARYYRDRGVYRNDGQIFGKREAGRGGGGPNGKPDECHHYGAGLIDMWLVTGDRSYLEAGLEHGYSQSQSLAAWRGFGARSWGRKMAAVLAAYKVTRDPKLKAWLVKNCTPRPPDDARRADSRALLYPDEMGGDVGSWMAGLCNHAIWHNWVMHQNEYEGVAYDDYRDNIIGLARHVGRYWFSEKFGGPYYIAFKGAEITDKGGESAYASTCVNTVTRGYLLTGDRKLLDEAVKFWNFCNGADKKLLSARLQDFHGMGSQTFWGRQLIYTLAHPRKDQEPPEAVADLKAEPLGGGRVRLTWTAPKDNGGGAVVAYQVKHAPLPMVAFDGYNYGNDYGKKWTWWAGYNVAGEPKPGPAGKTETMEVAGVPAGARWFCLLSRDGEPNESALSNCVEAAVR